MKDLYNDIDQGNTNAYVDILNRGITEESKHIYESIENVYTNPNVKKKVRHPICHGISKKGLKSGIIFSEVLGKPKGL